MLAPGTDKKIFPLRKVAERIQDLLLEATRKQFWVRAQFIPSAGNHNDHGHLYGEFVEYDGAGRPVARFRAMIWRDEYQRVFTKLKTHGQEDALCGQREICAQVAVRYHAAYGLSLQVFDVDPEFGESQLEKNRRRIVAALEKDGLIDRNKQQKLPAAPMRVGLITAPSTAAFADFVTTLRSSAFSFRVLYASSLMQGHHAARSVATAMKVLLSRGVDVICIVRGGGSPLELAAFDDEPLARQIANCPVPVWVGIGHEIDNTVLDYVAHMRHKTPTAAAEALVSRVQTLDERLTIALARLQEAAARRLGLADSDLERNANGLRQGLRKHLQIRDERLRRRIAQCQAAVADRVAHAGRNLAEQSTRLRIEVRVRLTNDAQKLQRRGATLSEQVEGILIAHCNLLQTKSERIPELSMRHLEGAAQTITRQTEGLRQGTRKHLQIRYERLRRRGERCRSLLAQRASLALPRIAQRIAHLQAHLRSRLIDADQSQQRHAIRLRDTAGRLLARREEQLLPKEQQLQMLRPERMLERGYSVTMTADGKILRNSADVQAGDVVISRLASGQIQSIVQESKDGQ